MSQSSELDEPKRVVHPPVTGGVEASSSVINVVLEENEEVNWLWTHYPNGQSVVTGYEVIKKDGGKTRFNVETAIADLIWGSDQSDKS